MVGLNVNYLSEWVMSNFNFIMYLNSWDSGTLLIEEGGRICTGILENS